MPCSTRLRSTFAALLLASTTATAQSDGPTGKDALTRAVDARADAAWALARDIWGLAEPGYQETRSAAALAAYLEKGGFKIEKGVAGIPTAFTATFGSGKPVIAVLGEYDALPELAQDAVPYRKPPATGNGYGHACGHHLFGVGSATACLVVAERLKAEKRTGTVRFYGCPAEEGGSAKVFLVRGGLFRDVDVCLHWHPSDANVTGDRSTLARAAAKFRFRGTAAHAAAAPEKGRSALDALLLTIHAVELLREHTPDGTKLHHTITSGGGSPNVVPEFAEGFFYVRHPKAEVVAKLYPRLLKCAQAGALATETKLEVEYLGGTVELLPNAALARVARDNLTALNDLRYDAEELRFALRLQESFPVRPALENIARSFNVGGVGNASTDVGDVSWAVPTGGMTVACLVPGTPGHAWQTVACGGTTIAKKGMLLAAKVLAANAWDLFRDPDLVTVAKDEFRRQLAGRTYTPLVDKDLAPPLHYRDPPKRAGNE